MEGYGEASARLLRRTEVLAIAINAFPPIGAVVVDEGEEEKRTGKIERTLRPAVSALYRDHSLHIT